MPKDLMSLVTQGLKCITKKRCKLTTLGNIRTCLTFWPLRFHTFFRWSTPHNHRQAFRANFLLHKKHFIEQVFVVNCNHRALCFKYWVFNVSFLVDLFYLYASLLNTTQKSVTSLFLAFKLKLFKRHLVVYTCYISKTLAPDDKAWLAWKIRLEINFAIMSKDSIQLGHKQTILHQFRQ